MMYAQVTDATITAISGRLPSAARRLDTREWVMGLPDAPVELQQACGWFEVLDVARPADTDTHTHDQSVELIDGTPTMVWTQRAWTPDELAANTAAANEQTLRSDPQIQIDALETALAALTAIRQRTNNEINANPAAALKDALQEVLTVTRRVIRLARLQLGALDSTSGT